MRDITSPNLTRLIGICTDTNNVAILTEHCSRGNLQVFHSNMQTLTNIISHFSLVSLYSYRKDVIPYYYYFTNGALQNGLREYFRTLPNGVSYQNDSGQRK